MASPNDEIYVAPNLLSDLAKNFRNVRPGFRSIIEDRLDSLGHKLVPLVKIKTPKGAKGRLARSTRHRVVRDIDISDDTITYDLQIIQDAVAQHQGRRSGNRYFYWYTVTHGTQPAGRLKRIYPPPENLRPWVEKVLGTSRDESMAVSHFVAEKIFTKGIEPNPYLKDVIKENQDIIQQTADEIAREIVINVTRLPSIER